MPDGLDSNAVRAQLYLNMADRARPAAPADDVRAQPDHRRLGQQGHQRRRAHAVGAAAVAQRLRQLPHAAARGVAQPDDGQVPRQRATTARRRRRPRPTRTTPASCCSSSRSALWELNNDGTPEARRRGASRSRATRRRPSPTSPARSPAGPTRRGRAQRSGNSNPEYFVGDMVPTLQRRPHDTDAKTLLNGVTSCPPG